LGKGVKNETNKLAKGMIYADLFNKLNINELNHKLTRIMSYGIFQAHVLTRMQYSDQVPSGYKFFFFQLENSRDHGIVHNIGPVSHGI
jgi:hypothetical protein